MKIITTDGETVYINPRFVSMVRHVLNNEWVVTMNVGLCFYVHEPVAMRLIKELGFDN